MAEASRSRVTITLGRSGQVVERAGPASDAGYSYSWSKAGSKRSIKDRLGGSLDSSLLHGSEAINKRRRGDTDPTANVPINKHDLRFKLMQKNARKRVKNDDQKAVDLRARLSRNVQPLLGNGGTSPLIAKPKTGSILAPLPPTRNPQDFPQMSSSRSSYSPWTLEHIRRRSPDNVIGTSRGLSPPRNVERFMSTSRGYSPPRNVGELQGRPLSKALDDVRVAPYVSKDIRHAPQPVNTAPFMTRTSLPPPAPKPPPPLSASCPKLPSQLPLPGSAVLKNPFTVDEHQTVDGLLNSLGLQKYAIIFKAEEVDMPALKQMGESDLKDLGIPMGPRKKILQALLPRSKRQP